MAIKIAGTTVIDDDFNVRNVAADAPNKKPSLLLDFANAEAIDPYLTLTRGSSAYSFTGRPFKSSGNALTNSTAFNISGAGWSFSNKVSLTNASSVTAPDGSTGAVVECKDGVTGQLGYTDGGSAVIGGMKKYDGAVLSMFVKPASGTRYPAINWRNQFNQWGGAVFDIHGGSTVTEREEGTEVEVVSSGMESYANGWKRCWVRVRYVGTNTSGVTLQYRFTMSASSTGADIVANYAAGYYLLDGSSGIYIWGAQVDLDEGSLSVYTPVDGEPITNYMMRYHSWSDDAPRIDYDPITRECKGLLIEDAGTNLVTNLFDSTWNKAGIIAHDNYAKAPDGSQDAVYIREDSSTGQHTFYQDFTISNNSNKIVTSMYAKQVGNNDRIGIFIHDTGTDDVDKQIQTIVEFNFSDGSVNAQDVSYGTLNDSGSQYIGDGWWRFWTISTPANPITTASFRFHVRFGSSTRSGVDAIASNYTGSQWDGALLWGAQIEQNDNLNAPTSYMKGGSGSSGTRAADDYLIEVKRLEHDGNYKNDNFTNLIGQTEGTIMFEGYSVAKDYNRVFTLGAANDTAHRLEVSRNQDTYRVYCNSYGTNFINVSSSANAPANDTYDKFVIGYKKNDTAWRSSGGAALQKDTSCNMPMIEQMRFGVVTGGSPMTGHLKKIVFWNERLPDATLNYLVES